MVIAFVQLISNLFQYIYQDFIFITVRVYTQMFLEESRCDKMKLNTYKRQVD